MNLHALLRNQPRSRYLSFPNVRSNRPESWGQQTRVFVITPYLRQVSSRPLEATDPEPDAIRHTLDIRDRIAHFHVLWISRAYLRDL